MLTLQQMQHGGVPPITYTWNPGALNGQTVSVSPAVNTVYTVTASDCGGQDQAQAVANVTVIANDNPGFTINLNPACVNAPVTITGLGAGPATSYNWSLPGGNPANVNGQQTFTVIYPVAGADNVILHYTSPGTNCVFDKILPVTFFPPIQVVTGGTATICPGQPATITAMAAGGDGGPYIYTWDNNAGNGNSVIVSPVQTTVYTVSATDQCGSAPATDQVTITVLPAPMAAFSYNPSEPSELDPNVSFNDLSKGAVTWLWDFGDNSATSTLENPNHSYASVGTYIVKLTITDANGCISTISYTLEVNAKFLFYIPNAFTPNGDGVNDYFAPEGMHDLIYEMTIYNRWGEQVFQTSDNSLPWSGVVAGTNKLAEEGVYVYNVRFKDSHYTSKLLVGTVTLLR